MKKLNLVFCLGCAVATSVVMAGTVAAPRPVKDAAVQPAAAVSTLADALAAAYNNNPALQQKRQELMSSHQKIAQAKSGYLPTISSNVSISGNNVRNSGSAVDASAYNPDYTRTSTRQGQITVSQNLFAGGMTVADVLATDQSIRAAWADLLSTEQKTFLDVIKSYLDVINKLSIVDIRKANHLVMKKSYETAFEKHSIGEEPLTQVANAESELAAAEAELRTAEAEVIGARATLSAMIGGDISTIKKPDAPSALPKSLDQAISIAIDNNPDVIKAQFDHKSAEATIDKINGNFLPKVDLQASSTRQEQNIHSVNPGTDPSNSALGPDVRYTNNNTNNQVQLAMTYELYSGGKYSSQKREAHDAAVAKRIAIEGAKVSIAGNVKLTFESYQAAKANIENYKKQVKAQEVALNANRQEMEVGTKVLWDVLEAQRKFVQAQVNLINAEKTYFQSAYEMMHLLGGLHAKAMKLTVKYFDPESHYDTIKVGF